MTEQRLTEIRERLDAATPGPWQCTHTRGDGSFIWTDMADGEVVASLVYQDLDARFIAHAPQDIADLLEAVQVARQTAISAVALLQAVRDSRRVEGFLWDESEWDERLLRPLEEATEPWCGADPS